MKVTVYVNKINKPIQKDFDDAQAYFKSKGVDVSFELIPISVSGYISQWNSRVNRYFVEGVPSLITHKGDVTMFVFNQNEWKSNNRAFPLLPTTPTGSCFVNNGKIYTNVGYYESSQKNKLFYLEIIHELMHALVWRARFAGFAVKDVMDTYYKNNPEQYKDADSNFEQQFALLKDYLKTFNINTVTITRTYGDKQTTGVLTATVGGATFICKSLELPWKNNARNISCIPAGEYDVSWAFSPSRVRFTYRLANVPGRSGILFHSGNYAYKQTGEPDIQGCILLGDAFKDINGDKVPDIVNSRKTIEAFERFMGKKPFKLIIK